MDDAEEYPNLIDQAIPYMLTLTILEGFISVVKKNKYHRLNDSLGRFTLFFYFHTYRNNKMNK